MMVLSPGGLCKLVGEIRTAKMTVLVICLFALRPTPTYPLLCCLSLKGDPCKLHSQARANWLTASLAKGKQRQVIQEHRGNGLGNFSPSLQFHNVFGSSSVSSLVSAPTNPRQSWLLGFVTPLSFVPPALWMLAAFCGC